MKLLLLSHAQVHSTDEAPDLREQCSAGTVDVETDEACHDTAGEFVRIAAFWKF